MPEDKISAIADTIDEIFGLHPPFWTLVEKTSQTILRLAEQGNVILIGRGANIITRELKHVFHVRLVGSLERRVEHVQELRRVGRREALDLIAREDRGRERYLKKYFGKHIDNPSLYHLTINTDAVSYEHAARMIAEAAVGLSPRKHISVAGTSSSKTKTAVT
jgi:cytidylate kinase